MLDTLVHIGMSKSDVVKKSTVLVGLSGEAKNNIREISLPYVYAEAINF